MVVKYEKAQLRSLTYAIIIVLPSLALKTLALSVGVARDGN